MLRLVLITVALVFLKFKLINFYVFLVCSLARSRKVREGSWVFDVRPWDVFADFGKFW